MKPLVKRAHRFPQMENLTEVWQIMDPKMDSGYQEPGEALEDEYNVLRDLLPEEIIGVMDQMLCFEVRFPSSTMRLQTILILIQVS